MKGALMKKKKGRHVECAPSGSITDYYVIIITILTHYCYKYGRVQQINYSNHIHVIQERATG